MNLQVALPSYLNESVKAAIAASGGRLDFAFSFTPAEKRILRKKKKIPPSAWAPKSRVISYGPFDGQLWRADLTPYLSGIMDTIAFTSVEEFFLVKGVQTGGSEGVNTFVGWSIEYLKIPVQYLYPTQKLARENSQDRIQTMIQKSPDLSAYYTGADDDVSNFRIKLSHMPIYVGWASSAAELSNKPIGIGIADETEIYPDEVSAKHADPLSELRDRLTVYLAMGMGKLVALSTPTVESGPIFAGFRAARVRFLLYVPCPTCGQEQIMRFGQVRWPRVHKETGALEFVDPAADDAHKAQYVHPDPMRIREEKLGRYACETCGDLWDDARRNEAVASAVWRDPETGMERDRYLRKHRPISVGMHLPSWPSWFFSISTGAALWVEYLKTKNKMLLKRFLNKFCAEPYTEYSVTRAEDRILALCDDRPSGLVPPSACALVAGIDTQDNGFWYWIHAFGYGLEEESWEIRSGFVDTLAALSRVILEDAYADAAGRIFPVVLAVQDAMGHRTAEVYDFCRGAGIRGRIVPFKGEGRMAAPLAWSKVDTYPGTTKPVPGGLKLLRANVNHFKDKISGKLDIAPADPGALHLTADFSHDKAQHLTAEVIDEKTGLWINPSGRPNHLWDCLMLAFVAADVAGVRYVKKPGSRPPAADPSPAPSWTASRSWTLARPGFLSRK